MKATKLNTRQILEVHKTLQSSLAQQDGTFCRYNPGESDATVAKAMRITPNQVAKIRRDVFGDLYRGNREEQNLADAHYRIDALREICIELLDLIQDSCDTPLGDVDLLKTKLKEI